RAQKYVDEVMNDWAELAVEGHFYADKPWWDYHERFAEPLSRVVGAKPSEVSVMNMLMINLHLMMVSFYRPTTKRFKILCDVKAFSSDHYLMESQVRHHAYDPIDVIVEIISREGEHNIRLAGVLAKIDAVCSELVVVLIGGETYYTGQVFDM